MDRYSGLAEVYDRFMSDYGYDARADYYLSLIGRAGCEPKTICECACGTGSMSVRFAGKGIRVTASDLSEEMLRVAQEKTRRAGLSIQYVRQDMTRMQVGRKVDAVLCCCDGVNYLLTDQRLNDFFRAAYGALKPGGVLAFDVSSAYKLSTVLGNGFFGEDRGDVAYLWSSHWDPEQRLARMDMTFFVQGEDERFFRFTEQHTQRAYSREELEAALTRAGFTDICVYGDLTESGPERDSVRLHVTAGKPVTEERI